MCKGRLDVWNAARKGGMKTLAGDLKGARFALWKNPEDLTANQEAKLSWVQATNQRLYRAYLLKEQLRQVFKLRGDAGIALLKGWLAWASRSKLEPFVELARSIRNHRAAIEAALTYGLTNARVESVNTKIRPPPAGGVRLPGPRGADRHGDARPRWLLPLPARPRRSLSSSLCKTSGGSPPEPPD
jgi:transposase